MSMALIDPSTYEMVESMMYFVEDGETKVLAALMVRERLPWRRYRVGSSLHGGNVKRR